ncbi:unnamed protein product, partial [Polarella glacialis]
MAPHRISVPLDRGILEALARVEGTDGLSDADICENFEAIHTILEHCDPRMVAKYFIDDRPVLFDTILENCRVDVVPFDVNVNTVVEFINAYHFFKLDLDPSDRVRVKEHRLTVYSMETAMLMLPELQFGANRELTVAFYFTVDDFGEEESDEKRFGFIFNTCRVFFSPEQDSAGIDQFRKVYIDWGIKGHEPERHDLSFSFLEGERIRCVLNLSQDGFSHMQVCKMGAYADGVFVLPLALTLSEFCHPTRGSTAQLGIFISAPGCRKSFSLESLCLLQESASALDRDVDLAWPLLMKRSAMLVDLIQPFMAHGKRKDAKDSHLDGRARLLSAVLQIFVTAIEPARRGRSQDSITAILKHIDRIVLRTQDLSKIIPSLRAVIDLLDYYVGLENSSDFEEEKAWLLQLLGHCCTDDENLCAELLRYRDGTLLLSQQRMLMDDSKIAWKEVLALRERSDYDPRSVHPVVMMQRAALFSVMQIIRPQQVAEIVMRTIDLKLERRIIGSLDEMTVATVFEGQDTRKCYTMKFVIVMRPGSSRLSKVPDFQPMFLGGETNLPTVYINLEDFFVWVQIPTVSGKLETFTCKIGIDSLPQGQ